MNQDLDQSEQIKYLQSIKSVRETNLCTKDLILNNKLENFDVDLTKLDSIVEFVINTIKSSFPDNESLLTIPVHGRYQHFEVGGKLRLTNLIENEFKEIDELEICRKIIDLFIVSVLLDAGAGNLWKFNEDGVEIGRSEGIAIASFHMFTNGDFSSSSAEDGDGEGLGKYQVNGDKLVNFTSGQLTKGFQVDEITNPLEGFDGRVKLIKKLGVALTNNEIFFGKDSRPGNLVDYLITKSEIIDGQYEIELEEIWNCLMTGFSSIWPEDGRIKIYGKVIGDAWFLKNRENYSKKILNIDNVLDSNKIVTFHKLTQWLTYSLFLPLIKYGKFKIKNSNLMTGLPEYRNGGLFIDFKLLNLKKEKLEQGLKLSKKINSKTLNIPTFIPSDDVIVEWRSCTICLLDYILPIINDNLKIKGTKYELSLPQLIEAGSWKSGRLIAKELRPENSGPPIDLLADGTVF